MTRFNGRRVAVNSRSVQLVSAQSEAAVVAIPLSTTGKTGCPLTVSINAAAGDGPPCAFTAIPLNANRHIAAAEMVFISWGKWKARTVRRGT